MIGNILSIGTSCLVICLLVGLLAYASVRPVAAANAEAQYAVIFTPGTPHIEAITKTIAAGGVPVRTGKFDFIIIATSKNKDFKQSVKKTGAAFLFSAIIKGACSVDNKTAFARNA